MSSGGENLIFEYDPGWEELAEINRGKVYPQIQGIFTSMQAQPHHIDPYARHELNLDRRISNELNRGLRICTTATRVY